MKLWTVEARKRMPCKYAPFHFSLWLSHESRQRRNWSWRTLPVAREGF
jgi:hypothetical protein